MKSNYEKRIDRESRETKLLSIYDNIEYFLFDMIINSHKKQKYNFAEYSIFNKIELINFLLICVYNVILIIIYYKFKNESNEIFKDKKPNFLLIIILIHIFCILLIIINWFYYRFKVEYFYYLSQYNINELNENERISFEDKVILLDKLHKNFSTDLSSIYEFFPYIKKNNKIKIILIDTLILNSNIFPYFFTLIFLLLYLVFLKFLLYFL